MKEHMIKNDIFLINKDKKTMLKGGIFKTPVELARVRIYEEVFISSGGKRASLERAYQKIGADEILVPDKN